MSNTVAYTLYNHSIKKNKKYAWPFEFQRIKAIERQFQFKPRLKLLSVHWSEDGFSQAACIDGLDSQKAGKRKGKEKTS